MNIGNVSAFAAIFAAAAVEGEIVFAAAAVLVASGALNPAIVFVAGALGAATGDQFYFYALRGRAGAWAARIPALAARRETVVARVRRHQTAMILALRFAPGLRIAIAAACAYGDVPPLRFSTLNTLSAFGWAALVLAIVSRIGPAAVVHVGLGGVWGAVIAAALMLTFGWWLGRQA